MLGESSANVALLLSSSLSKELARRFTLRSPVNRDEIAKMQEKIELRETTARENDSTLFHHHHLRPPHSPERTSALKLATALRDG